MINAMNKSKQSGSLSLGEGGERLSLLELNALVDVGRQHRDLHLVALGNVLGHLVGVAQHAGEEGGHELLGVVAF